MLSKELLTRWNRDAIIHASARDLHQLERQGNRLRLRRDPMDPRSFFEATTTAPAGVPAGSAGQATRNIYGTIQALLADAPASPAVIAEVLDGMCPWSGVKYRGDQVDHPNITALQGVGSSSGGVGIATATGDDNDGSAIIGTTGGANNDYLFTQCTHALGGFIKAGRFTMYAKLKLPDLTTRRDWLGAVNTGIAAVAGSATPAFQCVTVRYNSATTNWEIYTYDGAAGSVTTVKAGVAGLVQLLLMSDSTQAYARVLDTGGDSGWITKTTNLPATGTDLSNYGMLSQATAAAVKTCRWYMIMAKFR